MSGPAADGGAAFPCTGEGFGNSLYTQHGMSLRDWFAGQCLGGVMAQATGMGSLSVAERAGIWAGCAGLVYEMADAMLAARAQVRA